VLDTDAHVHFLRQLHGHRHRDRHGESVIDRNGEGPSQTEVRPAKPGLAGVVAGTTVIVSTGGYSENVTPTTSGTSSLGSGLSAVA
jgi:hypothetical protein